MFAIASKENTTIPATMMERPITRSLLMRSPRTRTASSAVATGISPGEITEECRAGAKCAPPTRIRL